MQSFDSGAITWTLVYPETGTSASITETAGYTTLNERMQKRFNHDHGARGLQDPSRPRHALQPDESASTLRARFIAGIDRNWTTSKWAKLQYDHKHFIPNWATMLSVPENSEEGRLFKIMTSDAMFKILPGEHDAVKAHASACGCKDTKKLRRKYFKLLAMYSCPEPEVIVNGLLDVYFFFKDLPNPNGKGGGCLTADAEAILKKELKYVQLGLLSDIPGMKMYVEVGVFAKSGRTRLRCIRGTNALEGQARGDVMSEFCDVI